MNSSNKKSIDFLWHSFLKGDDKSFSIIYQQHINRLLLYGRKLCTNREIIHDCIQEIFLSLFVKRKKLGVKIENLNAYLFVALRNCLIKKIIKNRKTESLEENHIQEYDFFNIEYNIQDQIIELEISTEIKQKLKVAVDCLSPKQKEIVYLKFEEEMDYKDIADILDISVESARKLLYRALLSLRKVIDSKILLLNLFSFFKKK